MPAAIHAACEILGGHGRRYSRCIHFLCEPFRSFAFSLLTGQSRQKLEALQTVAATIPATPAANPLEDIIREMLRPMLKQWLDEHLPHMVDEHVKREISRITGRPL